MIKYILVGTVGLALGGVCGYLLGKKLEEEKREDIIGEEVDGVRKYYDALLKEQMNVTYGKYDADTIVNYTTMNGTSADHVFTNGTSINKKTVGRSDLLDAMTYAANAFEFGKMAPEEVKGTPVIIPATPLPEQISVGEVTREVEKQKLKYWQETHRGSDARNMDDTIGPMEGVDLEEMDLDGVEDEIASHPEEKTNVEQSLPIPLVISMAQFNMEEEDFEKETWMYFRNNRVLVDSEDDVVSNYAPIIGEGWLPMLGHTDVVHVRNAALRTDYEITAVKERYEGELPDPEDIIN